MGANHTCQGCAAFSALTSECRRHAPTAIVVEVNGNPAVKGIYPSTHGASWCDEYVDTPLGASVHK